MKEDDFSEKFSAGRNKCVRQMRKEHHTNSTENEKKKDKEMQCILIAAKTRVITYLLHK